MNQLIIQQAAAQLGVKEIVGEVDNEDIVGWAHEIGLTWIKDDEVAWCAVYVGRTLKRCGLPYLSTAAAQDYLKYGVSVMIPEHGDIVVFDRGHGKGHIGFFCGFSHDQKMVYVIGGNQGNQVSLAPFAVDKVLGYRRPIGETTNLELPSPPLAKGANGEAVRKLQGILLYLKMYTKKVDGDFGDGTVSAVIAFQTKNGLPTTGQFDQKTYDKLFTILNA